MEGWGEEGGGGGVRGEGLPFKQAYEKKCTS
jgi:hypothetical protein